MSDNSVTTQNASSAAEASVSSASPATGKVHTASLEQVPVASIFCVWRVDLPAQPMQDCAIWCCRDRKCVLTILRAGTRCRVGDTFEMMLRAGVLVHRFDIWNENSDLT